MAFAAGASLAGSLVTNATNYGIAQQQMAFQERMSNSAYQRQVTDMRKAGINPILAVTKGGGASTPQGTSPQMEDSVSTAVNTALSARRAKAEVANMQAQNEYIHAQAELARTTARNLATETAGKLTSEEIEKTKTGKALRWIDRFSQSLPSVNIKI